MYHISSSSCRAQNPWLAIQMRFFVQAARPGRVCYNCSVSRSELPPPTLVTTHKQLTGLIEELMREAVVAVDTESNSLYAYRERVCLIQFSTSRADYLVDPLQIKDLSALAKVFRSDRLEKVFHAAEYDVICLKRDFGFEFANLFDTMVAARTLGWEALGLGNLLEKFYGVQLNKRFQRANWGKRPLPDDLLSYARLDTHYLIPLRDKLKAELIARGRWELAQEDFVRVCRVEAQTREPEEPVWRIKGASDLEPQQLAVLQELCLYREEVAQHIDRPVFKVISNKTLMAIAETEPHSNRELAQLPGMTRVQMRRHAAGLLGAVQKGQASDPPRRLNARPANGAMLARLEALRNWRKRTAREMGVKSDVVLPRDLMQELADRSPQDQEALARVLNEAPWRLERFGQDILYVLSRH